MDEATIMNRTGHHLVDGVRAYKRITNKMQELSSAILNDLGVARGHQLPKKVYGFQNLWISFKDFTDFS